MKYLVSSINKALENKNWYAALFLALTLPDICGKIQYPKLESSEKRYVQWFNKYLSSEYTSEVGPNREKRVFLSGEDCYALRCSLLHEGVDVISHQRCRKVLDSFLFIISGPHCNYFTVNGHTFLQLDVGRFCKDVCNSIEAWLDDVAGNNSITKRLADTLVIHTSGVTRDGIHIN